MNLKTCIDNCISIIKGQTEHIDLNVYAVTDQLQDQHVFGDELHLRQVFINILGNAVKFTPEGGSITLTAIETKKEGNVGTYTFAIKDTGKGMSEKFIPHIFDAFSQEEEGSRTKYKGTGLGMAITKKFVDKMGGNITVTSKEGYGTTFTIEVPFDINVDYVEEEKDEETSDINVEGLKVLLVEDNMLNMEIAKTLLEDVGVIVTSAYNGQEAVDIFENSKKGDFDAIFMDVMMPVLNGLDATEKISNTGAGQAVLSVMNFMANNGIIKYSAIGVKNVRIIDDRELIPVRTEKSGFFEELVSAGDKVIAGKPLANILDPYEGTVLETLYSPVKGTVFFIHNTPLTYANTAVIKILEDED